MAEFILRARKAPTDPAKFLGTEGRAAHVEYLAQVVINTLFVSKKHRQDAVLTVVCEGAVDYSRALTLRGDRLGTIEDLTEQGILRLLGDALEAGKQLAKEELIEDKRGIGVQAISFERLVKQRMAEQSVYLLDKKGTDVRREVFTDSPVILLTDHIPMPKKSAKSLMRQGAKAISLGPVMLHASQCVVLVQNELDRQA